MSDPDPNSYERVEMAFDKYRASGLALMTTIIGLSAASFGGLFHGTNHRQVAFLYMLPIALALLQQLTHYFGSRFDAWRRHLLYAQALFPNYPEAIRAPVVAQRWRRLHYTISDHRCWLACLAFGLVSLGPLIVFRAFVAMAGLIVIIAASLITYLWLVKKWQKDSRQSAK
jgi:hypothetical protein